ncbi:MAG: Mpo1-like protein [Elusimicrobiota bacterium]
MLDLVIRGGLFFDGLGSRPARRDVGIRDGRVFFIAPRVDEPAREYVDAAGLWVTPGFVDVHTRYDLEVEIAPGLEESVRHGVTSVVIGHGSLSLTVGEPRSLIDVFQRVDNLPRTVISRWLESASSWRSMSEYFHLLRSLPLGPNVAPMLGHSALRLEAMGLARALEAPAGGEDLARMRKLAEAALDAGCVGVSVDVVPWHRMGGGHKGRSIPSEGADLREYAMLADVCRARDAVFQVSSDPRRILSLVDFLGLSLPRKGRALRLTAPAALDYAHRRQLWRLFGPALYVLNRWLGGNIRFQTAAEPVTVYSDGPVTPLFEDFSSGAALNDLDAPGERRALWKAEGFREGFRKEWLRERPGTFHRDLARMTVLRCPDASLEGKSFAAIARELGREPVDIFMDLLESYDVGLRWVATIANDRPGPRQALLRNRYVLPGLTEAGACLRHFGRYDAALSVLKQAVADGCMSPERAVHRVTGEPAQWYRLEAGVLREGARADLVLLDPEVLAEPISGQVAVEDPSLGGALRMVKRGSGRVVRAVYIGGKLAFEEGRHCKALGRKRLGELLAHSHRVDDPESYRRKLRNRISDDVVDHPFTDHWEVFVLRHQDGWNVACHMLGVGFFFGVSLWALAEGDPWLLALLPLSYLTGLVGHALFEWSHVDPRDALFSLRGVRCVVRLFGSVLTGAYWKEVASLRSRLETYRSSRRAAASAERARPEAPSRPIGPREPADPLAKPDERDR